MNNSNASGKSKGVLLFATNTESVDYVTIARRAERLIKHYLRLPVTIVETTPSTANKRYNIDTGSFESWHNKGRGTAYDLSPYDQTLLLDCDYLVFDDNLLKILESLQDYAIVQQNDFIDGTQTTTMGKYSLHTLWATVIAFNKTNKTRLLFELVKRIERNYPYYWRLYNVNATNFRNDFAFTIADNIINGYTQDRSNYIPWPILTINRPIQKLSLENNKFFLEVNDQGYVLPKQSLHVMSKEYLLGDALESLIEAATNA